MYKRFFFRIVNRIVHIFVDYVSDETYLKWTFARNVGYIPDLINPRSFNEKLQWLKLHDQHPEYTRLVDKISAKDYVASIIGKEYIIPTIGVWDSVENVEWESLPNQFVIKCSGDSGGVVVCKNKSKLDIDAAKKKLKKGWGKNYFRYNKEYPYKNIRNRIIAELYMEDESGYELKDYKFFCFNGSPRFLKVDFDRQTNHKANYYSLDWELLPFYEKEFPQDPNKIITKPQNFEEMIEIARRLSQNIPFVRIDLYNINGMIYFGEITFFPASGLGIIEPIGWDEKIGEYIKLPL